MVLPIQEGSCLKIRTGTSPEPVHKQIYPAVEIPLAVIKPRRSWVSEERRRHSRGSSTPSSGVFTASAYALSAGGRKLTT